MNQMERLQQLSLDLTNFQGQANELSNLKRFVLSKDETFKTQLQPYIDERNIALEKLFAQCTKSFKDFALSINRFDIINIIEKQEQQHVNELKSKADDIIALFTNPAC